MYKRNRPIIALMLFTITVVIGLHGWHTVKPAAIHQEEMQSLIGMDEDQIRGVMGEPSSITTGMPQGTVWEYESRHLVLCWQDGRVYRILERTDKGPREIAIDH
jgi:hypothetical protein